MCGQGRLSACRVLPYMGKPQAGYHGRFGDGSAVLNYLPGFGVTLGPSCYFVNVFN